MPDPSITPDPDHPIPTPPSGTSEQPVPPPDVGDTQPVEFPPIDQLVPVNRAELQMFRGVGVPQGGGGYTIESSRVASIDPNKPTLIVLPGMFLDNESPNVTTQVSKLLAGEAKRLGGLELAVDRIQFIGVTYPSVRNNPDEYREVMLNNKGSEGNRYSIMASQVADVILGDVSTNSADRPTEIARLQKALRTKVITGYSMGSIMEEGIQNAMMAKLEANGFSREIITKDIMPHLKMVGYGELGIQARGLNHVDTGATALHILNANDTAGENLKDQFAMDLQHSTQQVRIKGTTLAMISNKSALLVISAPNRYVTVSDTSIIKPGEDPLGHAPPLYREDPKLGPLSPEAGTGGQFSLTEVTGRVVDNTLRYFLADAEATAKASPGKLPPPVTVMDAVLTPTPLLAARAPIPGDTDPTVAELNALGYSRCLEAVIPDREMHPVQEVVGGGLIEKTPLAKEMIPLLVNANPVGGIGSDGNPAIIINLANLAPPERHMIVAAARTTGAVTSLSTTRLEMIKGLVPTKVAEAAANAGSPAVTEPIRIPPVAESQQSSRIAMDTDTPALSIAIPEIPPDAPHVAPSIAHDVKLAETKQYIYDMLTRLNEGNVTVTPNPNPLLNANTDINNRRLTDALIELQKVYPNSWLTKPLVQGRPEATVSTLNNSLELKLQRQYDDFEAHKARDVAAGKAPPTITHEEATIRATTVGTVNTIRMLNATIDGIASARLENQPQDSPPNVTFPRRPYAIMGLAGESMMANTVEPSNQKPPVTHTEGTGAVPPKPPTPVYYQFEDAAPHPVQFIAQDGLFLGMQGFGHMGMHGGINPNANGQNILAINANEITPHHISEAASHVLQYRLEAVTKGIAKELLETIPRHVIAEAVFPEFIQRSEQRKHKLSTSLESYGRDSGGYNYDTASNRVLNMWKRQTGETIAQLIDRHRPRIIQAITSQIADALGMVATPEQLPKIEQAVRETLEQSKPYDYHNTIEVPGPALERMTATIHQVLTEKLHDIAQNPQPVVDRVRQYIEDQTQKRAQYQAELEAQARPKSLRERIQHAITPAPPDRHNPRPVEPALAVPEEAKIAQLFQHTMEQGFTPAMRAIVYDSGVQILLTASGSNNRIDNRLRDTIHRDTSYSDRSNQQLHLLYNQKPGQEVQALSPQVMLEESFHYVVTDPRIISGLAHTQDEWRNACEADCGFHDTKLTQAQTASRQMLQEHYIGHTPTWKRTIGPQTDFIAELSYEIRQAGLAGVSADELRQKLPNAYPLYENLMATIEDVGGDIIARDPHVAALVQSNALPPRYAEPDGTPTGAQKPPTSISPNPPQQQQRRSTPSRRQQDFAQATIAKAQFVLEPEVTPGKSTGNERTNVVAAVENPTPALREALNRLGIPARTDASTGKLTVSSDYENGVMHLRNFVNEISELKGGIPLSPEAMKLLPSAHNIKPVGNDLVITLPQNDEASLNNRQSAAIKLLTLQGHDFDVSVLEDGTTQVIIRDFKRSPVLSALVPVNSEVTGPVYPANQQQEGAPRTSDAQQQPGNRNASHTGGHAPGMMPPSKPSRPIIHYEMKFGADFFDEIDNATRLAKSKGKDVVIALDNKEVTLYHDQPTEITAFGKTFTVAPDISANQQYNAVPDSPPPAQIPQETAHARSTDTDPSRAIINIEDYITKQIEKGPKPVNGQLVIPANEEFIRDIKILKENSYYYKQTEGNHNLPFTVRGNEVIVDIVTTAKDSYFDILARHPKLDIAHTLNETQLAEIGNHLNNYYDQNFHAPIHDARDLLQHPKKIPKGVDIERLKLVVADIETLSAKAGIPCPEIKILMSNDKYATAAYKRIYVSAPMLMGSSRESQNFTFGHELGHIINNDVFVAGASDVRHPMEFTADRIGAQLSEKPRTGMQIQREAADTIIRKAKVARAIMRESHGDPYIAAKNVYDRLVKGLVNGFQSGEQSYPSNRARLNALRTIAHEQEGESNEDPVSKLSRRIEEVQAAQSKLKAEYDKHVKIDEANSATAPPEQQTERKALLEQYQIDIERLARKEERQQLRLNELKSNGESGNPSSEIPASKIIITPEDAATDAARARFAAAGGKIIIPGNEPPAGGVGQPAPKIITPTDIITKGHAHQATATEAAGGILTPEKLATQAAAEQSARAKAAGGLVIHEPKRQGATPTHSTLGSNAAMAGWTGFELAKAIHDGDAEKAKLSFAVFAPNALGTGLDLAKAGSLASKTLQKAAPWMMVPTIAIEGWKNWATEDPEWLRHTSESAVTGLAVLEFGGFAAGELTAILGTGTLASGGTALVVAGVSIPVALGTKWGLDKIHDEFYGSLEGKFDPDLNKKTNLKRAIDFFTDTLPAEEYDKLRDDKTHKIEFNKKTIDALSAYVNKELDKQEKIIKKTGDLAIPILTNAGQIEDHAKALEMRKILNSARDEISQVEKEFTIQHNVAKGLKTLETADDPKLIAIRERMQRGYTAEEMNQTVSTPTLSRTSAQIIAMANTQAERDAQYLANAVFDVNVNDLATRKDLAKQLQAVTRQQVIQQDKMKAIPEMEAEFSALTKRAFEAGARKAELDGPYGRPYLLYQGSPGSTFEAETKAVTKELETIQTEMAALLARTNPDKKVTEVDKSMAASFVNNAALSGDAMFHAQQEMQKGAKLLEQALGDPVLEQVIPRTKYLVEIEASFMNPDGISDAQKQKNLKILRNTIFQTKPEVADQYVRALENKRDEAKFTNLISDNEKKNKLAQIESRIVDGHDHISGDREQAKKADTAELAQLLGGKKSDQELAAKWVEVKEELRDGAKMERLSKAPEQMMEAIEIVKRSAAGQAREADSTKLAQLLGGKKDGETPSESDKELAESYLKLVATKGEKDRAETAAKAKPVESKIDKAAVVARLEAAHEKASGDLKKTVENYADVLIKFRVLNRDDKDKYVDLVMKQTTNLGTKELIAVETDIAIKTAQNEIKLTTKVPTGADPRKESQSLHAPKKTTPEQWQQIKNIRDQNYAEVKQQVETLPITLVEQYVDQPIRVTMSGATPGGPAGNDNAAATQALGYKAEDLATEGAKARAAPPPPKLQVQQSGPQSQALSVPQVGGRRPSSGQPSAGM